MSVVNVKVEHIRPQHQNLKEWCEDPDNVYIGRRGIVFIDGVRYPPKDSPFANPYKVTKDLVRNDSIGKYKEYIVGKLISGEIDLEQLRGKNLGCWCKPESCHGDVLIELLGTDDFSSYLKDDTNESIIVSGKSEIDTTDEPVSDKTASSTEEKVKNPESGRMIIVGKGVYNNLIKKGYVLVNGELKK